MNQINLSRINLKLFLIALLFIEAFILRSQNLSTPNVIVIVVDDMGYSDLGYTGSDFYESPKIDSLAQLGMVFNNGYAASAVCSPTRASILTGRYPSRTGVTDWIRNTNNGVVYPDPLVNPTGFVEEENMLLPKNPYFLDGDEVTIADALKEHGYVTAHVGKWHLGPYQYLPEGRGFDYNIGGEDRGSPPTYFAPYGLGSMPYEEDGEYLTDREAIEVVDLINELKDTTFFIELWHYAVHTPIQAKNELIDYFMDKATTMPDDPQSNYPKMAAMIKSVDEAVGEILDALQDNGLMENTLIIFTSDNGGKLGDTFNINLRDGKGFPYEGGIREPYIFYWPGVTTAGTSSNIPISSVDIFPTIIDAIDGATLPEGRVIDGKSLKSVLEGNGQDFDRGDALYWHFPHYRNRNTDGIRPYSIIRQGNWKLLKIWDLDLLELYHLSDDPEETTNLASVYPDTVKLLHDKLTHFLLTSEAKMPIFIASLDNAVNPDEEAFTGNWQLQTNTGTDYLESDYMESSTKGDSFTFSFYGNSFELISEVGPLHGKLDIYIDDVFHTTLDMYHSNTLSKVSVLSFDHLDTARHELKGVVSSEGSKILIDAYKTNVVTYFPASNAASVPVDTKFKINFPLPATPVDGKSIYLRKLNGELAECLDASTVDGAGTTTVEFEFADNLKRETTYEIRFDQGAFTLTDGYDFDELISGSAPWIFSTENEGIASNTAIDFTDYTYIDLSENGISVSENFTLELWIKPYSDNNQWNGILGYNPGTNSLRSPYINMENNSNVQFGFGDGNTHHNKLQNGVLTLGEWQHIAYTFDGITASLYKNGSLAGIYDGADGVAPVETAIRYINKVKNTASSTVCYMDEVRFWNTVRTTEEINEHMLQSIENPETASDLIGYWQFEEEINDLSITGNDGTPYDINDDTLRNVKYVPADYGLVTTHITTPQVVRFFPADNRKYVYPDSLMILFNEKVLYDPTKSIAIYRFDGDTLETISQDAVVGSGTRRIALHVDQEWENHTSYFVEIDSGAFVTSDYRPFEGTVNHKTWNFTTSRKRGKLTPRHRNKRSVVRKFYPNPSNDKLVISLTHDCENVRYAIRTLSGELIQRGNVGSVNQHKYGDERTLELNMQGLKKGTYILNITADNVHFSELLLVE